MPSEYVKDLVNHKIRVAGHMQHMADGLVERIIEEGDILPYYLEDTNEEPLTLLFLIAVACKMKCDPYGAQFDMDEQVSRIVHNTLTYLELWPNSTSACQWIAFCVNDLFLRAAVHDTSKFDPEEFEAYEEAFPELQQYAYGTDEFKAALAKIRPAIEHHYKVNDHHPEHFEKGINDMHVVQLIEMSCDWMAASERSQINFAAGLEMNRKRFGIGDQLFRIIKNTVIWHDPHKLLVTDSKS